MDKIYLEKNIFYIENFLTQEEIDTLMKDCLDLESWESGDKSSDFWKYKIKEISLESTKSAFLNINKRISLIVDDEYNKVVHTKALQRILPTDSEISLEEHYDSRGDSPTDKNITKGIVIYINDDYLGGEIEYTKKNIVFKPKSGMIIVHPGTEEYSHRVLQVKEKSRYIITAFAYDNDVIWD